MCRARGRIALAAGLRSPSCVSHGNGRARKVHCCRTIFYRLPEEPRLLVLRVARLQRGKRTLREPASAGHREAFRRKSLREGFGPAECVIDRGNPPQSDKRSKGTFCI